MTESIPKQIKLPTIKRFANQQIASISEAFKDPNTGKYDVRLISKGMIKKLIEEKFPPTPLSIALALKKGKTPPTFNMRELIRSIIVEVFEKIGSNRERGNVRHLFYTHIIHTLIEIMQVTNIDSLNTTINDAWKDVIDSGIVTYEGMNIESGKGKYLLSFTHHSPFSNFIICVEKDSFLESLSWIAKLFRITIITAGGQPSRAAHRAFVHSLAKQKCDLNKPFYLLVITDLDPAGWYIQEAFASQIEKSIRYYNEGKGEVKKPIRLFLRLDQISDKLIQEKAISAKDKQAKTAQTIKSSKTKVKRFKEKLGDDWERLFINNEMKKVELDVIDASQMEEEIASQLLLLIDDHSLIIIPELMNEVERQRELVIQEFYELHKKDELDSIIDDYLEPIKNKRSMIDQEYNAIVRLVNQEYNTINRLVDNIRWLMRGEIQNIIQPNIDKYDKYIESLVSDKRKEIETKESDIEKLQEEIDEIQEDINSIEIDIDEKIGFYTNELEKLAENLSESQNKLSKKKSLLLDPHKKVKDQEYERIEKELKIFNEKIDAFKSQQEGKFGSYLRSVEKQFQDSLNSEKIPIFFNEVEFDSNVQIQLAYLLTQPNLLLKENKSCLEHPKHAFTEPYLLNNSLNPENIENTKMNPDLSKFRNAFSKPLVNSLKYLMKRKLDPIEVVLDAVVDLPEEYTDELETLIEEIKAEIELNKIHLVLNYQPEDKIELNKIHFVLNYQPEDTNSKKEDDSPKEEE